MKPYIAVPLAYLGLGVLWIIATDRALNAYIQDTRLSEALQTAKGWLFVVLSTLLIWFLNRRAFHLLEDAERDKQAIFKKTLEGSHHILLNYLNQMQLVTLEAQKAPGFDQEVLEMAQRVSRETAQELRSLEDLRFGGPDDIHTFIYRGLRETREAVERSVSSGRGR